MFAGIAAVVLGVMGTGAGAQGNSQGNPPGNNGTVKVNGEELKSGGRGNDPHVGCTFSVSFWNFDAGAGASVSFAAHPPTGRGVLVSDSFTLDGDGADGSMDASASYNLASFLQGAFEPHPQQGYHVKLTVHADGSQGADTKHKVFWTDCPPPGTTTTTAPEGTTTTTAPPTTTTTAAVLGITVTPAAPQVAPQAAPQVPAAKAAETEVLPTELARTGAAEPWVQVGAGVALLLCGYGMVLVGRRRTITF